MKRKGLARATAVVALAFASGLVLSASKAYAQAPSGVATASLPAPGAGLGRAVDLPDILNAADAALYADIFALQRDGRWKQADALIEQIRDPLLMGHVRFQRYMHPTKYRSSYKELKVWMDHYADHPGAPRVYKLAKRRQPKGWKSPRRPRGVALLPSDVAVVPKTAAQMKASRVANAKRQSAKRSAKQRREIRRIQRQIRRWVASGSVTKSLNYLNQRKIVRLFDPISFDESLAKIAAGYFFWRKDKEALAVASQAAQRSGEIVPIAYWWAGLAAWRLGDFDEAARHFQALAESKNASPWSASAGGYWASRAYLVGGWPERVNAMLRLAAQHPRTFYGLMAYGALGLNPPLDFELPALSDMDREILLRMEPARRALALIQIGQHVRAESELRRFAGNLSTPLARVMLALAAEAGLADLSYRTAEGLQRRTAESVDAALFPVPVWEPEGGFTLDRAFLYAVMRQESKFRSHAKSRRGARGLMQLMPRTASVMAGKRYRGANRRELLDPVLNVTLGQKYLNHLLSIQGIDGNLFYALTAYNGGPGNMKKWRKKADYRDDPLLYIESIPSRETRIFIERVLTNLWVYRYRLGQPPRSLEATIAGNWPTYIPLDGARLSYATYGNR